MKIYSVEDEDGTGSFSFHATKKEAEAVSKWWRERGNETEIETVEFELTRRGVVQLLNRMTRE